MAERLENRRFPHLHARLSAEQMRKLREMAQALDTTPASAIRLLIDKAHIASVTQIVFSSTDEK